MQPKINNDYALSWSQLKSDKDPMKKVLILMSFLIFAGCAQKQLKPVEALPEGQLSLVVNVDGIQCCEGVMRLAVYNDSEYWLSSSNMVRGRLSFVLQESQTYEIHGLPKGKYAVVVYQDTNNDSKLDRWFGLLPKEPYGFSNNVGRFGPASFNKAAINLYEDKTISIQLN